MVQGMKFLSIADITPSTTDWRVKVLVLDKTNAYTSEGGRRTQKVLLQDKQGGKIEAILWDHTIEVLKQSLLPFSMYTIGGARVQPIKTAFLHMSPGMTLQWVFTASTYIRPITETHEGIPYPVLDTVPLANIRSLAGTRSMIDIIAVVIDTKPPKECEVKSRLVQLQEYILIDQELKPMMLTMWADFLTNQGAEIYARRESMPIIVCRGLTATPFSGGSLSTVPFSYITLDPDIPQVKELRAWVDANTEVIKGITQQPSDSYLESTKANNEAIQITDISLIQPDTKNVHINASMSIPDTQQKVYYSTCPKCSQLTEAQGNEGFHCNTCNTEQIAVPRCKVSVELEDITGNITATLFDKCAEKLLQQRANELHEMDPQGMKNLLAKANKGLRTKKLIVEIRASKKKYTDKKTRYTVHDWIEAGISTTQKNDSSKTFGDTPDKEEGNKVRTALQETPEPASSKKDKRPRDPIESSTTKKVKLEFPEKT